MDQSSLKENNSKLLKWTKLNKKTKLALEDKQVLFIY